MSENAGNTADIARSKRTLKETIGTANAVTQRLDQGYDAPLNWDQTLEAVQHPTTGLNRLDLVEVIAYLGAQLVGARNSIDSDAALAIAQVETVIANFQHRRSSGAGRVHNHSPYRPVCNERPVAGQLRGACLNDDGSDR